ncbi:DUF6221 family protein [Streptomyces lavendulae]|uniref:DUF6221 family protein n=1 Tax=Streptomyces lavendulae TaxID=1914 RepID=UPI0033F4E6DC
MDDLVQFLRARLDEEEHLAKNAADHAAGAIAGKARKAGRFDPPYDGNRWANDYDHVFALDGREGQPRMVQIADCGGAAYHLTPHIAHHDPARVLAEVDAKRRLLNEYEAARRAAANSDQDNFDYADAWVHALAHALRFQALPYAEHEEYLDMWRPRVED